MEEEVKQAEGGKQKAEGKNAEVLKSTPSKEILQMKSDIEAIKVALAEQNKILSNIADNLESFVLAWSDKVIEGNPVTPKIIEYKPKEKKRSFNEKK